MGAAGFERRRSSCTPWKDAGDAGCASNSRGWVVGECWPGNFREIVKSDKLEIGRILHLKLEIKNLKLDEIAHSSVVQFKVSDF